MPSASTAMTWSGSLRPAMRASRPGIRLSRIRVVLPDPDTPVTTVSRPLGMSTSRGFTVWMAPVDRWTRPYWNSSSSRHLCRIRTSPFQTGRARSGRRVRRHVGNRPLGQYPAALRPRLGPISMSQWAWDKICVSWSTRSTELPSATRSSITAVRPAMLAGVEADGGLVQHVQHPGGPVAHRPGQLHPLRLPGGQGGRRAVQGVR